MPTAADVPNGPPRSDRGEHVERDAERRREDPRRRSPARAGPQREREADGGDGHQQRVEGDGQGDAGGDRRRPTTGRGSRRRRARATPTPTSTASVSGWPVGAAGPVTASEAGEDRRATRPAGCVSVVSRAGPSARASRSARGGRCRRRRVTTSRPAPATTAPPAIMTSVPESDPVSGSCPLGRWIAVGAVDAAALARRRATVLCGGTSGG